MVVLSLIRRLWLGIPLHKPYPYNLYLGEYLHFRYLKCLVMCSATCFVCIEIFRFVFVMNPMVDRINNHDVNTSKMRVKFGTYKNE